jgi:FMN phosphatase YigB (HAD superfamily)
VSTLSIIEKVVTDETTAMQSFGRARLADYCGDMVIYRNLKPLDPRMPNVKSALREAGLPSTARPRKQDPDYAKVALWYADAAREIAGRSQPLEELLFIGDTLFNDGNAFLAMQAESGWRGSCFIGVDRLLEEPVVSINQEKGIYSANRWAAIGDWVRWLREEQGFHLDERTLVVIDIDKTALGAKGRNDQVIDEARIDGAARTLSALLGRNFDPTNFVEAYRELNQSRYHCLTEDNQDYLAYICLVLSTNLVSLDEIKREVAEGSLDNFDQFTRHVETRMMINNVGGEMLRQAHDAVVTSVRNGDPTPFKRFRRQEFITTLERMGNTSDDADVEELLDTEITLTEEVWEVAEWLKDRGSVLLCLSDKPDEASTPNEFASPDLSPVHQAETHRVGFSVKSILDALD